jgi:hypothetical protein
VLFPGSIFLALGRSGVYPVNFLEVWKLLISSKMENWQGSVSHRSLEGPENTGFHAGFFERFEAGF